MDSLCICPGQAVWTLYVDLVCLHHDGNLFDAAVLACSAALKDVKLPTVSFDMETSCVTATSLPHQPLQLSREEPFPFSLLLLTEQVDHITLSCCPMSIQCSLTNLFPSSLFLFPFYCAPSSLSPDISGRNDRVTELVDPLKKELLLDGALVNMVLGPRSEDCLLYFNKKKGGAISQERLLKCIQLAQKQQSLSATLLSNP